MQAPRPCAMATGVGERTTGARSRVRRTTSSTCRPRDRRGHLLDEESRPNSLARLGRSMPRPIADVSVLEQVDAVVLVSRADAPAAFLGRL
jgi:hypothetical protein